MGWFTSPIQVMPIGTYSPGDYGTWLGTGSSGGSGSQDAATFDPGSRLIGGNYPAVPNTFPPPTYQPVFPAVRDPKSMRMNLPAGGIIGPFTTRRVGLPDANGSYPQWVPGKLYRLRYAAMRDAALNVGGTYGYIRKGPSPWGAANTLLQSGAATFPITIAALNTWEYFAVPFTADAGAATNDILFQFNGHMTVPGGGHLWIDQTYIEEWATSPPNYESGFAFGFA